MVQTVRLPVMAEYESRQDQRRRHNQSAPISRQHHTHHHQQQQQHSRIYLYEGGQSPQVPQQPPHPPNSQPPHAMAEPPPVSRTYQYRKVSQYFNFWFRNMTTVLLS